MGADGGICTISCKDIDLFNKLTNNFRYNFLNYSCYAYKGEFNESVSEFEPPDYHLGKLLMKIRSELQGK